MSDFTAADRQVLTALRKMKSEELRPLYDFLVRLNEQTKLALIREEGTRFSRLQGKAGLLQDFIDSADSVDLMLDGPS